ncbi:MAG: ribosome biogenesis GTPase Der [Desulfosudaceae bacterium]
MKPVVVIMGRPNAGKSTLFNRVTRSRDAIVDDMPGVTRDRHYKDAVWNERSFTLVDTGGFMGDHDDPFMEKIRFQIDEAVKHADAVIMILDGKGGLSPFDREMLPLLQKLECPVFYLVNKIDGPEKEADIYEFYSLGIENLYPVSAAHGYGLTDFLDELVETFPESVAEPPGEKAHIAVVGRPNVGKSTLINRVLGEDRLIVSDVPGTTRDSLDTLCERKGRSYLLIDTAGLRKKSRVREKIERFSAVKTLKSLERCDVALIVCDALQGVGQQDVTIAGYAYERGCGCIFLVNKWDVAKQQGEKPKKFIDDIRDEARFLSYAPALTVSAKTGFNVSKVFEQIDAVYAQYCCRVNTGTINTIIERAVARNEPSLYRGRRLKFNYATQISEKPPTFICFVNFPEGVHFSYQRYLVNCIRRDTGLDRVPIRLYFRQKTGRRDYGSGGRGRPARSNRSRKR